MILNFQERHDCPACGNAGHAVLYDEAFAEGATAAFLLSYYEGRVPLDSLGTGRYTIAECTACGTLYQRQILDDPGMEWLYEHCISASHSLAKREKGGPGYFQGQLHSVSVIGELLDVSRPREVKVLDFGMGWGHWAFAAHASGYDVAGAELSPSRIAFAGERGIPTVDTASLPAGFYHFVNQDQVLEHVPNPREVIAEIGRLLKPGGIARLFFPDGSHTGRALRDGWKVAKNELQPLEHINAFTRRGMDAMTEPAGLERLSAGAFRSARRKISFARKSLKAPTAPEGFFRKRSLT